MRELAKELHKPVIKKFEKRKVYLSFIDKIWGAVFANMQLISRFNKKKTKQKKQLLCVISMFSKYA